MLLLTACASSPEELPEAYEKPVLKLYVFEPDRPIVTRDGDDKVNANDSENTIHSLYVWVFETSTHNLVSYISLRNVSLTEPVTMDISDSFANNPDKPNVDVFVLANVTASNCGITLDGSSTYSQVEAACIEDRYFGPTSPLVSDVPDDGLPMSGSMKNQYISGTAPVFEVRPALDQSMSIVKLVRAVSKVRFVLCRATESDETTKRLASIDDISLDANLIPTTTYLFPTGTESYTYSHAAISYGGVAKEDIPAVDDPHDYVYAGQSGQDYENMVETAVSGGALLPFGLTYLRESPKQLTGTVSYKVQEREGDDWGESVQATPVAFSMSGEGDFLRNHTWIVYIYFMDSKIHVLTVAQIGMKEWTSDGADEPETFYNW